MPCSTVIGRSVFSRIVRHGTPSAVVSSWMPPESVSTRRALAEQPEHLEIALRRQQCDRAVGQRAATSRTARCCARARGCMGQISGKPPRHVAQQRERLAQRIRVVDVRGPVQRHDAEPGAPSTRRRGSTPARAQRSRRRDRALPDAQQRIDHHVADEADARPAAMPSRSRLSAAARSVVYRTSAIWSVSTRLISSGISRSKLRSPASTCTTGMRFLTATRLHASVELTSPTTMTQDGAELVEHGLEAPHDLGRLYRVGAGTDLEIDVGRRQLEIGEQPLVHRDVVVLAGMHEHDARQLGAGARTRAAAAPSSCSWVARRRRRASGPSGRASPLISALRGCAGLGRSFPGCRSAMQQVHRGGDGLLEAVDPLFDMVEVPVQIASASDARRTAARPHAALSADDGDRGKRDLRTELVANFARDRLHVAASGSRAARRERPRAAGGCTAC